MNETRPLLLDLFCGAGGAAMGYHRAGFTVIGVDHKPQPRYPFGFIQADALEYLAEHGREYDAIHASPPCQAYSTLRFLPNGKPDQYPDLIPQTRDLLNKTSRPYVIENIMTAPLEGVRLCGTMFGLPLFRHRRFESNILLLAPSHVKHKHLGLKAAKIGRSPDLDSGEVFTMVGAFCKSRLARQILGIEWMTRKEAAESIPPAYTEFIGRQLIQFAQPQVEENQFRR